MYWLGVVALCLSLGDILSYVIDGPRPGARVNPIAYRVIAVVVRLPVVTFIWFAWQLYR
jgi:hypothetical protein